MVINKRTKAACQPQYLIKKIDSHSFQGHWPSKTNKPTIEHKNSDNHKSKSLESNLQIPHYFNNVETSKKAQKKKKKTNVRIVKSTKQKKDKHQPLKLITLLVQVVKI